MFKSTEVMSVKAFMNRDYHMDALSVVLGSVFVLGSSVYIASKAYPSSVVAYKAVLVIIALL